MKRAAVTDIKLGATLNGAKNVLVKKVLSPSAKYSGFLDDSQWWAESHLRKYQVEKLQKLVRHAFRHVPYYRGVQNVFNIKSTDIRGIADLQRIPILEKETVRRQSESLLSTAPVGSPLYKCHTSGTTGTPLTLYRNLTNVGFEYAMLRRQRRWAGLDDTDFYATLKGDLMPPSLTMQHVYWMKSPFERKLLMSSYHLSEETADYYIDALQRHGVQALDGYPSSIYALAVFMLDRGIHLPMKAILTSSETLAPNQKALIEKAFQAKVYDYYGMAERVAAMHTCEHGNYHVVPEYAVVEFIRNQHLSGMYYEIVGTGLTNFAMPLIRYRMGDVVELSGEKCACGREYPVVERIVGRMDDYIVTPSGKLVGRLDHIFKGVRNLVQAQIYQPDRQKLILRIVPDTSFEKKDGEQILEKLYKRIGEDMQLELQSVQALPRSGRGKIQSVISDVDAFSNLDPNEMISLN